MKWSYNIAFSFILLLTFVSIFAQKNQDTERFPNIVLVMNDQLIPFLTGAYGNTVVKTPNLDKLAASGVLFREAYSPNPICSPARACLITGRYSSNIGAWDNAAPLHSDVPTICHYLHLANYETVLSGKMHFVGPDQRHGYDRRLIPNIYPTDFEWTKHRFHKEPHTHAEAYLGKNIQLVPEGADLYRDRADKWAIKRPKYDFGSATTVNSGFNQVSNNDKFDKWALFKAKDYLAQKQQAVENGSDVRPFFLTVSFNMPHEPFYPPAELNKMYQNAPVDLPVNPDTIDQCYSVMDQWLNHHHGLETIHVSNPESIKKVRRAYYALVTYADLMLGELLQSLQDHHFDDNTIIIFTSDHGDMLLEKDMVQKRSFYEWSSHIPMIIRFPQGGHAGTKVNTPVSLIDLLPTMLDIAHIQDSACLQIDGKSLLPLVTNGEDTSRYVISEMHSEGVYAPCFMVRKGAFKYIYIHGYGSQLFDLQHDPGEWHNLVDNRKYAALVAKMRGLIFKNFDPEDIEARLEQNLGSRLLIQQWLENDHISWDYMPEK